MKLHNIPIIFLFRHSLKPFLLMFLLLFGCNSQNTSKRDPFFEIRKAVITLDSGENFDIDLSITHEEQIQGLSGILNQEYPNNKGMLFVNQTDSVKRFWMPDTYFDLDIFFLDNDLTVVGLNRNVPHHPGRLPDPPIALTDEFLCRHILELKSDSEAAKKIIVGTKLKITSLPNHPEFKSSILTNVKDFISGKSEKEIAETSNKILDLINVTIKK